MVILQFSDPNNDQPVGVDPHGSRWFPVVPRWFQVQVTQHGFGWPGTWWVGQPERHQDGEVLPAASGHDEQTGLFHPLGPPGPAGRGCRRCVGFVAVVSAVLVVVSAHGPHGCHVCFMGSWKWWGFGYLANLAFGEVFYNDGVFSTEDLLQNGMFPLPGSTRG